MDKIGPERIYICKKFFWTDVVVEHKHSSISAPWANNECPWPEKAIPFHILSECPSLPPGSIPNQQKSINMELIACTQSEQAVIKNDFTFILGMPECLWVMWSQFITLLLPLKHIIWFLCRIYQVQFWNITL